MKIRPKSVVSRHMINKRDNAAYELNSAIFTQVST